MGLSSREKGPSDSTSSRDSTGSPEASPAQAPTTRPSRNWTQAFSCGSDTSPLRPPEVSARKR